MPTVIDIACPACARTRSVRKVALGRYRCTECECEFTPGDLPV